MSTLVYVVVNLSNVRFNMLNIANPQSMFFKENDSIFTLFEASSWMNSHE